MSISSTSYTTTCSLCLSFLFFFNDTSTTEFYTLSLHDALPILFRHFFHLFNLGGGRCPVIADPEFMPESYLEDGAAVRSEEHTSELQSRPHLVCRLLLEKKKKK